MTRHLPALFGATAALFAAAPAWANAAGQGYGSHMGGGWGWGHFIFGPLMMIVVVGAIVALVVLLVRWIGGPGSSHSGGHAPQPAGRARDLLDETYARGEIERDDYLQRKKDLG